MNSDKTFLDCIFHPGREGCVSAEEFYLAVSAVGVHGGAVCQQAAPGPINHPHSFWQSQYFAPVPGSTDPRPDPGGAAGQIFILRGGCHPLQDCHNARCPLCLHSPGGNLSSN